MSAKFPVESMEEVASKSDELYARFYEEILEMTHDLFKARIYIHDIAMNRKARLEGGELSMAETAHILHTKVPRLFAECMLASELYYVQMMHFPPPKKGKKGKKARRRGERRKEKGSE